MTFLTKKIIFITILFLISNPSYSAHRVRILGEEIVPLLKRTSALPKHFLLESTKVSKRLLYVSPRYQRNSHYFEEATTSWLSSLPIFWAGAIGLGSAFGYYLSSEDVSCAPKKMEKVSSHWGVPREGYKPRKIQEDFEKRINDERKKGESRVLVIQGPLGAGKTVLTCDSVWEVQQRNQKFLGHFFHSVDDKKSLKKQIISFAYYLGMPRSETNYEKARDFIEQSLTEPDAKGFVIIFDGAANAKKVNKFLFKNPKLKGLQIITTQDEKFDGYQKAWDWTYFQVKGLEKEEAVEFLLLGLSDRIKETQKIDQEKAQKLVDIIGNTLPFNIVDLITQINLEEVTIDEVIRQKNLLHNNIVKARLQRKPGEVRNILYSLSAVPYAEIPLSLIEMLNDPSGETSSSLVMRQLVREGILKSTRADVYEIHPMYQKAAMEVYIEEKRKHGARYLLKEAMNGAQTGAMAGLQISSAILGATSLAVTGISIVEGVALIPFGLNVVLWGTSAVAAGTGIGAGVGALAGLGMAAIKTPPTDDDLKKEFLMKLSQNIVHGCSSKEGVERCQGFLGQLKAMADGYEKEDVDVKDLNHLIKKLKKVA
jgi:NB-ARC domain